MVGPSVIAAWLVLNGLSQWEILRLIAGVAVFVGIPLVGGAFVAMIMSKMGKSGWAGFVYGAMLALIVIGVAYAVF